MLSEHQHCPTSSSSLQSGPAPIAPAARRWYDEAYTGAIHTTLAQAQTLYAKPLSAIAKALSGIIGALKSRM